MKIKKRHIAATLMVISSIAVTPACISVAYRFRGYKAFGGEYLVIPPRIIIAVMLLELAKQWDFHIRNRRMEARLGSIFKAKKGGNRNRPGRVCIR